MKTDNPFFHRGAISDPDYFFGRERETRQIASLLTNNQSVSLVGQRRLGKTSLLFYLLNINTRIEHRLYRRGMVYIDCGGLIDLTPDEVFGALLDEITTDITGQRPNATGSIRYREFEAQLETLSKDYPLVIVLDEFELMSSNPALDVTYFSALRALATRHPVAYVTASKRPLLDLTYADTSALSSPFFNIFATVRLSLFTVDEAKTMLNMLASKAGVTLTDALLDTIYHLGGTHPMFAQVAAYHVVELLQQQANVDAAMVTQSAMTELDAHFTYYWRNLSPMLQRTLVLLRETRDTALLHDLEQSCLIVKNGGDYDYFCGAFRDFVRRQSVDNLLQSHPVTVDATRRIALLHGVDLSLTPTQFDLLCTLVQKTGEVFSTDELESAIWGDEYIDDPERLKSVIKGLRRALGDDADKLENVRGVGYLWRGQRPNRP